MKYNKNLFWILTFIIIVIIIIAIILWKSMKNKSSYTYGGDDMPSCKSKQGWLQSANKYKVQRNLTSHNDTQIKIGWNYTTNGDIYYMVNTPTYIFKNYPDIPINSICSWTTNNSKNRSLGSLTLNSYLLNVFPLAQEVELTLGPNNVNIDLLVHKTFTIVCTVPGVNLSCHYYKVGNFGKVSSNYQSCGPPNGTSFSTFLVVDT